MKRFRAGPAVLACAAIASAIVMWGFTVDDALISIRYARHLAQGVGYRFNASGPSTDGVTPAPWPFLIALIAHAPPLVVLTRLRVLGVALHALAALLVGFSARESPLRGFITTAIAIAACLPFAAWGVAGMETPLASLLCALCVFYNKDARAAVFAGFCASIRPELLPWAVTIAGAFALARRATPRAVIANVLLASVPFVVIAIARDAFFGRFAPLAVLAKPSDLTHGAVYAIAAVLACGVPFLLVARQTPTTRAIAIAFAVHVCAIAAAGGDSMPYARLLVPVLPSVFAAHLYIATNSRGLLFWLRSAFAVILAAFTFVTAGPRGRHVMRARADLIARAEPLFENAHAIASVDVGWVSASYEGTIVDLAGLTDPEIAVLQGGHTSKHVDASMLLDRGVDTVVFYTEHDLYAHGVAVRLASDPLFRSRFIDRANLVLDSEKGYVVFTRRAAPSPEREEAQ